VVLVTLENFLEEGRRHNCSTLIAFCHLYNTLCNEYGGFAICGELFHAISRVGVAFLVWLVDGKSFYSGFPAFFHALKVLLNNSFELLLKAAVPVLLSQMILLSSGDFDDL